MAESVRNKALDNLVTTLAGITTGGGYTNTIASVSKRALDWETGPKDVTLPAIGVFPLDATYEYLDVCTLRVAQRVAVEFIWDAADQDAVWADGDSIVDDIVYAISVDRTRGGNAMDTRIESMETDSGNPDTQDHRGGTAGGIVRLVIDLHRPILLP